MRSLNENSNFAFICHLCVQVQNDFLLLWRSKSCRNGRTYKKNLKNSQKCCKVETIETREIEKFVNSRSDCDMIGCVVGILIVPRKKCENKWSRKFCVKLEKCDLRAVWWLFRRGKTIFEISECHLIESHYFGSGILPSCFYYCPTFRAGVRLISIWFFKP